MSVDPTLLDVLFVWPDRFRASPQVGVACRVTFEELALYLSRPSVGESKDEVGAWSPALYRDNVRRKGCLITIGALVVDIDENGDVDAIAASLARYSTIVHETFSSTTDRPRCRVVVELTKPVDWPTYERAHAIARAHLRDAGVVADDGAKDASRLSYAPVRRYGAGYRYVRLSGAPLDAEAVIASQPIKRSRPAPPPPAVEHRDRYVAAALRDAARAIARASDGARHHTLCREAFALARFGVSYAEIEAVLLPAFVAAAGATREYEGRRTIRDALFARRGAA